MKKYLTKKNMLISIPIIVFFIFGATAFFYFYNSSPRDLDDTAETAATTPPPIQIQPSPTSEPVYNLSIAPLSLGDITITPLKTSALGVEGDSGFIIETHDDTTFTETELKSYLSVKSGEDFTLVHQQENKYHLQFNQTLAHNRLYNLIYSPPEKQPMSYAFQTADFFRITATTPAHDAYHVPVNTGIEITFYHPLSHDLESVFEIDPFVNGRFLQNGNTYIFAPDTLEKDTRYTVTIKGTAANETGDTIVDDYIFHFNTEWGDRNKENHFSITGDAYETFLPWDDVFVELNVAEELFDKTFKVEVYDLQTPEDFISFNEQNKSLKDFSLIETMEKELHIVNQTESYYRFFYILLEKPLPEGYYLVQTSVEHNEFLYTAQKFIQVSALSVYSMSISGETCYWVHDAATGDAAKGAFITAGNQTVVTTLDGIAMMETNRDRNIITTIDYADYHTFVYTNHHYDSRIIPAKEKFHSYMYTDRQCYKPNDTIDIYGAINPRAGYRLNPKDEIILKLGDMYEFPLTLNEYGVFDLRVPVTNMYGYMYIKVFLNGEELMFSYIRFLEYNKYSYILSGETDRVAYFTGNTIETNLFAATVVDAPVSGLTLRSHDFSNDVNVTTDHNGKAVGWLTAERDRWEYGWQPYWKSIYYQTTNESESSQTVKLPVIIAPSDIMLEYETGDDALMFSSYSVDIEKLETFGRENMPYSHFTADAYRGEPVDLSFQINITQHVTTRTVASESYDFINKRTITRYNYSYANTHYKTISTATLDGRVTVSDFPISDDPFIRYSAEVTFTDRAGREALFYVTLPHNVNPFNNRYETQESSIKHFRFAIDNNNNEGNVFSLNQTKQVFVGSGTGNWYWDDIENVPVNHGRMLMIAVRDNIVKTIIGNATGTAFTFTEEYINNAFLFGAYFDGRYIYPVSYPFSVQYDHNERNLNIDMVFDREGYEPSDEVTVKVQATDNNGLPKETLICISVVDETSILDGGHSADFLSTYYQSTSLHRWPLLYGDGHTEYASHRQHDFGGAGGGAEQGEGGEDGFGIAIRDDFTDNPVFMLIETDAQGFAEINFKLVDTITSWRVTALGLTKDGYAGDVKNNINSSLPFYIDMVLTNEFIAGDDIGALIKAYGRQYQRDHTDVRYTFVIETADARQVFSDNVTSSSFVTLNAGKLEVGEYTLTVTGEMGNYSDGMAMPFRIVENPYKIPMISRQRLPEETPDLQDLHLLNLPVQVTMSNGDIWPIMNILYSCMDSRSHRTDVKAATAFGEHFIRNMWTNGDAEEYAAEEYAKAVRNELFSNHHGDGIPELIYGDENFRYTARFVAAFPEFVSRWFMAQYFRDRLNYAPGDLDLTQAAGYFGLAALGEPVLFDIYEQIENMSNPGNQSLFDQYQDGWYLQVLYYAAALCALGDDAGALRLMQLNPYPTDLYLYPNDKETVDTLLLYINTTLDPEAAYQYLKEKEDNVYISDVSEKINFIKKVKLSAKTVSEVQYTLQGINQTVTLANFDQINLAISKEQFDNLNIECISGSTDLLIRYYGDGRDLKESENRINITKRVVPTGMERSGVIYQINFDVQLPPDAPWGTYKVFDRLQSNMRFIPGNNHNYSENVERQLVELYYYYYPWFNEPNFTVSYDAMKVFDADSVMGTAYISNGDLSNHLWGKTE